MTIDYTQNEADVLVSIIRQKNYDKPLTSRMVRFGRPYPFTPTPTIQRDTVVTATSVPGSMYVGSQTFYYNRKNINDFVVPGVTNLTFFITTQRYLSDILADVSARLGIKLSPGVVYNVQFPPMGVNLPVQSTITIEVAPNSLVYQGKLDIIVALQKTPLADELTGTSIDGLYYNGPQYQNIDTVLLNTQMNGFDPVT